MVRGALRSRSKVRTNTRVPSGTSVRRYERRKKGKATSPHGKPLPGVAHGTKTEIAKLGKTERRPSRPYGGILNSPETRAVMIERVEAQFASEGQSKLYEVGSVCIKIAGRDAGKICVITEVIDANYVSVAGDTRPRKVNVKHIEPTGKSVAIKKGASEKDVQAALK